MKFIESFIIVFSLSITIPLSFSVVEHQQMMPLLHGLQADDYTKIFDERCSLNISTEIYLNYTITGGNLKRICSIGVSVLYLELESVDDDGFLILDLPKDIFLRDGLIHADAYSSNYDVKKELLYVREYFGEERANPYLLPITKIKSYDTFERFKISLLKDDVLINLVSNIRYVDRIEEYGYHPQKYTTIPLQQSALDQESKICKSDLVPILKHDKNKSICVKPSTYEKLILRGWMSN